MDKQLWTTRLAKMMNKLAWSTSSTLRGRHSTELIHQRSIAGDEDGCEFVRRSVGTTYIEPTFGYLVSNSGCLIEESLLPNFSYPKSPWRIALASFWDFYNTQRNMGRPIKYHRSVITLRHLWEWNYYHFYLDVLGKIQLFDKIGIDPTTPLLLGRYALELPFVQEVINRGELKQRNWIIQDNSYIVADEVYFCRTRQRYKDKMDYLLDLMETPNHLDEYNHRIFLTRGKGSPRSILNMDQIEPILREYGFQIIDAARLSTTEKINLFSKTRYLVAIHGAGMTNMIYRRDAPMSVLEIHPTTYVSVDYRNMCHEWGYHFDRLACPPNTNPNPQHDDMYVDPIQLRQKLSQMLNHQMGFAAYADPGAINDVAKSAPRWGFSYSTKRLHSA